MDSVGTLPSNQLFVNANQTVAASSVLNSTVQDGSGGSIRLLGTSSSTRSQVEAEIEAALVNLNSSGKFFQSLHTVFDTSFSLEAARKLHCQWLTGDFSSLPNLQIRPVAELDRAQSAFSTETNTLYLSQDYIQEISSQRDAITGILLEEIGHFIAAKINSSNAPDSTPPTAGLMTANVTNGGNSPYQFTVTYSDETAMDIAMLDSSDLWVTGPNSFSQTAALVSVDNSLNGSPRTATYQINPPDGQWDFADNGTYSVLLQSKQVADTSGNFMPASTLGTFSVSMIPPITDENIIFPADAGVLNVKDFGARGDGIIDDTAAIQAALNAYPNGKRIITCLTVLTWSLEH